MAMAGRNVSVAALGIAGGGALLMWAAIKGTTIGNTLRSVVAGQVPATTGQDIGSIAASVAAGQPGADGNIGAGIGAAAGGSAVAQAALRYLGSGGVYRFGGARPTGWDCSGYVNYVLNHDMGLPIPGYARGFDGSVHGPVTGQWAVWSGAVTIPRAQVQAGDILVWTIFHMGIAVSSTQMINCPGPDGTAAPILGHIDGGGPGPLVCRRLRLGA